MECGPPAQETAVSIDIPAFAEGSLAEYPWPSGWFSVKASHRWRRVRRGRGLGRSETNGAIRWSGRITVCKSSPPWISAEWRVLLRTWAGQAGLKTGCGLSNYWEIDEAFVYHGHDRGVTEMYYMADYGVGDFYSIN